MAQMVEHILGKDEVTGSIPVSSSSNKKDYAFVVLFSFFSIKNKSLEKIYYCTKPSNKVKKCNPFLFFQIIKNN